MPSISVPASSYVQMPNGRYGHVFDYSAHKPLLSRVDVVESIKLGLSWYQNKPEPFVSQTPLKLSRYFRKDGGAWINYGDATGNYGLWYDTGWRGGPVTSDKIHIRDKDYVILMGFDKNYMDVSVGEELSPRLNIEYTFYPIKTTLNQASNVIKNEPLTISWSSDKTQVNYELKIINNGNENTLTGTTAQYFSFDKYAFEAGTLDYKVRVSNGYTWSEWESKTIQIEEYPINLSLEPNKIAQNKDKPIVVMWSTSDEQTQFELLYSGSVSGKITGTTAKIHTFPPGTFSNGMVKLTLRVFNGYVWTEKVAEFMAYGAPPNPMLTTLASYDTAIPNFTWTAAEQVSYRVQVLKNDIMVLDSADVYSSNKNHRFTNVLENNTTYVARLRIRNQYEIESEWVSKTFAVAFTELQKPNFDMFANDRLGTVMLNIYNAIGQSNFSYCEILRREYGETTWNRIVTNLPLTATYTDYTCRSGVLYEYKVRAVGTSGGYTDSEIEIKEISLRNTMISDTADFNNYVVLIHNPAKARGFAKETHAMQYSGSRFPSFEFGEVRYTNMNISFTVDAKTLDKLLDLYYSNNILLLRDNRGKKIYGHISGEPSAVDAELMNYTVSFNFTETNYIEGVLV